jgi:hypothetical protein
MSEMTTHAPRAVAVPDDTLRLRHALHAEWLRFAGLRSTWATLALTLLVSVGLGILAADGRGSAYAGLAPADRAAFDPTQVSLACADVLGQLTLATLAILVITSEYATGTIRGSLAVVPRRGLLLTAKTLLVAGVSLVVGELVSFASYLAGQAVLATHAGVPHTTLGDPHVLRAVTGSGVLLMLCAVLGLALGFLTRATAGALTLVTTLTLLVPLLSGLLPSWLARWWPPTAGSQLARVVPVDGAAPVWPGFAVLVAAVAAAVAAAAVLFRERDA